MRIQNSKPARGRLRSGNERAQGVIHACRSELAFDFVRAAGPGGQKNVNKVSTAVQLRFDLRHSRSLSEEAKRKLLKLAGKRMTSGGILVIEARRHRTQRQNRAEALARFETLLLEALAPSKLRRATRPTSSSIERRTQAKKHRAEVKRERRTRQYD